MRGAEIYLGWGVAPAVAAAGHGTLRWVHTAGVGVGAAVGPEFRGTGAALTNSRGVHAEPMADWAVTAVGCCLRGFHAAIEAQRERRWAKGDFADGSLRLREFRGARIGLVGLGGIGRAIARRCHALGMEVRAVRRRTGRPRPAGVRWVGGPDRLGWLAARSDVLVLAAPHTPATERVVDDTVLGALPAGGFLVNLARGDLVDEAALRRALAGGRLAGCVLDVFCTEPLAPDHWIWAHPRVLVTPHVSGVTERFWERETALIVENVGRYRSGRRLRNLVDLEAGY